MKFFAELGKFLLMIKSMFSRPENWRMYWREFMHQCSEIGIGSLGIVVIISIFMGAVSTVQTAYQLTSPLIQKYTIAQVVRDTVILEFAPTLVCIVLAGVVGSKIAGELGMQQLAVGVQYLGVASVDRHAWADGRLGQVHGRDAAALAQDVNLYA